MGAGTMGAGTMGAGTMGAGTMGAGRGDPHAGVRQAAGRARRPYHMIPKL